LQGFTLIEVLLAMSLLALVLTGIYTSFSTASRSVENAEIVRDETDLARTLISRLSLDIENADCDHVAYGAVFYGKKEEVDTEGVRHRHDSLAMTTLTNFPRPNSKETELLEADYYFKEKENGKGYSLMRREKRELVKDGPPPFEGGVEYEITDQVSELRFRYSDNGSIWLDGWGDKDNANKCIKGKPAIVEMTLVLTSGKQYSSEVRAKDSI
jgi:prepilin-type N-terminal cleavage/methylation domain-containing protein